MTGRDEISRYETNLADELDSAALYDALAGADKDAARADLFRQLASAEREHARFWTERLSAAGCPVPAFSPSLRTRVLARLARWFGSSFVLPALAAAEFADRNKYAGQADAIQAGLSAEEQGHASVLRAASHRTGLSGADIARAERWHRGASGNDLRAAVLGANDGLVSNFCLLAGVAGGAADQRTLLLAGVAGLIAGACSMALGEWLSVTNAREMARTQLAREARELQETPEAERKELALILQAKGVGRDEAHRIATQIMADPQTALDTLAREELGIDPDELGGDPWRAALVSFLLFALGAALPVVPFAFAQGGTAVAASVALSCAALWLLGAATALFNGRGSLFSSVRQILIGVAAATVTYGVGRLFGATLG